MSQTTGVIPASSIVNVIPGVLSAGGQAVDLTGLFLTTNTRFPIGQVLGFADDVAVADYAGAASKEASKATIYFSGFTGCQQLPGTMLIAQYPLAPVAAYLRGGSIAGLTLAQLQAVTGVLEIVFNGMPFISSNLNLSTANSASAAATLIEAAFTAPTFTVSYDTISGGLLFTSSVSGAASSASFAVAGTAANALNLTAATGAIISPGADAATPSSFMNSILGQTQNWAGFTTLFDPDGGAGDTQKLAFAAWTNAQQNRFFYVPFDANVAATEAGTGATFGEQVRSADLSGTFPIYEPADYGHCAFVLGYAASIDFDQENGRFNAMFRNQTGLVPAVNSLQVSKNLDANGYNYYAAVGAANPSSNTNQLQTGQISGPFAWLDSYINQIWMNSEFQVNLLNLLQTIGTLPYNADGDGLIKSSLLGTITQAINFGAIVTGVALSANQVSAVNRIAGANIATILQSQGYYILVGTASAEVRAARGTPPVTVWYTDGQSVQKLVINSVQVQ